MRVEVTDVVPVLPAGIYEATFETCDIKANDQGDYFLWTFSAMGPEGDLVNVTATTSPRITPRTKAAKFLAGLGVDVTVGATVDFDELAHAPCMIVITINDGGYSRIESVLPYQAPKKAAK